MYPRQHMPERESVTWGHAKRGEHCLQTFEKKGVKFLGGGNCNQGLWNPNWQDMDLQSFVLKKNGGYFQVYTDKFVTESILKLKLATSETI